MVCTCRPADPPFVNLGGESNGSRWWIHVQCGKPREHWVRSLGDKMLNYFLGGELDGKAYALTTLLEHQEIMEGYSWTPEVITSKITGATARVWRHQSLDSDVEYDLYGDREDLTTERQEERPMPSIEERRKGLGISRQKLADAAGLTHAKIYRIEHDGVRTTEDERKIVNDALDRVEAERSQPANPR